MESQLDRFVREALQHKQTPKDIARELKLAGWPEEEIQAALDAYVDSNFPVPIPKPPKTAPRSDVALHFLKSVAFGAGIWAFVDLLFTLLNLVVPEPGGWRGSEAYGIRHAVATLTVTLPLYVLLHFKLASRTPRWLAYATIGASGIVAMASAVLLVGGILEFKGNWNGGLKLSALIAVMGVIILDYIWVLKRDGSKPRTRARRAFELAAAATVTAAYVGGFILALSHRQPMPEREPPPKPVPVTAPAAP